MLTPDLEAINESVIYITLNDNITYVRIKRTDYEALLDEIKRLLEIKANWLKGLVILDNAGVWTGADDDIADRIQVVLQGYLK